MNTTPTPAKDPRHSIMEAIRKGEVHMKPRWHFVLLSALSIVGVGIVFLTLLYIASLGVFFLRDSGVLFAPSFGGRGWLTLLNSLPWLLIGLLVVFAFLLEYLVRRYSFVYKKPLLVSILGIFAIILIGGFLIAETPFHHTIMISARHGELPPPITMIYSDPVRLPPPSDVYRGEIIRIMNGGFVLVDEGGAGTTSVLITPQTRLPYGEDFSTGERVLVIGDASATGTVRAFGIREIDQESSSQ